MLGLLLAAQPGWGQAPEPKRAIVYTGRIDYDSYFGFYPTLSASLPLDSLHELTGYATYYTNPDFLGVETGVSAGFASVRRNWSLTPGMGLVSGSLFVSGRPFALAEGFVGSLTVQHEGRVGFVLGYAGYYGAWKRLTPDTYDFLYYTVQAGRYVSKRGRISLIYERLANVRLPRNQTDESEFNVPRLGLATDLYLSGTVVQAVGGWTRTDGPAFYFRLGISRSLSGKPH